MRLILVSIVTAVLSLTIVGCNKKAGGAPQAAPTKVDEANAKLARMKTIDSELQARGIFISSAEDSEKALNEMPYEGMHRVGELLSEFVRLGNEVNAVSNEPNSNQPNAIFPGKVEAQVLTTAAGEMNARVQQKISEKAGGTNSPPINQVGTLMGSGE